MNLKTLIFLTIVSVFMACSNTSNNETKSSEKDGFDFEKDLLLAQFDCKTDVDDLHTVAAFATLMADSVFSKVNYHAVAGTYGVQDGLYVPPNDLFQLVFGNNWTDAHENLKPAVEKVKAKVKTILENKGDIWIAEAGQSNFSAELVKAIQTDLPEIDTKQRFHLVQHSDWNQEVTDSASLQFVKENTDYHKIPDGNAVGNGTPGFRTDEYTHSILKTKISNPKLLEIWQLAIDLSNQYNGKEGRYNNEAVAAGGLDFSDLSETCWIFGIQDIKDTEAFFELYGK